MASALNTWSSLLIPPVIAMSGKTRPSRSNRPQISGKALSMHTAGRPHSFIILLGL